MESVTECTGWLAGQAVGGGQLACGAPSGCARRWTRWGAPPPPVVHHRQHQRRPGNLPGPPPLGCAAVVVAAGMMAWPCNASQGSTPGASNPGDSHAIDEWL